MTCIREDGTSTYFRDENQGGFFAIHDLTHFAIESTLGFTRAFFGLVAAGRDLDSFNQTGEQFHPEALQTEKLSGLVLLRDAHGNLLAAEEISEQVGDFEVSEDQLEKIRGVLDGLIAKWRALKPGECLEVDFPVR